MADEDAGTVKATVKVVYEEDGSFDKAKQQVEDTTNALSALNQGANDAGGGLAQLTERVGTSAGGTNVLAQAIENVGKILGENGVTVSEVNNALGGHEQAVLGAGDAYRALQEPLGSTISLLENASPPMMQIAEHAQTMAEQLAPVSDGFVQIQEAFSQTVPMLPQFADSLHQVSAAFDPTQFGLNTFAENMNVFQDALVNPEPFSMIQSHLTETGQTWSDFTSSIGTDNTAMLHEMAANANVTHDVLGGMSGSFDQASKSAGTFTDNVQAAMDQFNQANPWNGNMPPPWQLGINKQGGVGSVPYGPEALPEAQGIMGGINDFFGGFMTGLNNIAMPLMAVQMIGMAVQAVGTSMYNAAAIAEGPAAHSFGTFTGSVDALAQSSAKAGQTFSESFGQQLIPTINALNYSSSQGGGLSGLGGILGGAVSAIANVGLSAAGFLLGPIGGPSLIQAGGAGFAHQLASWFGQPMPFQGPGPQSPAQVYTAQQMPLIGQQVDMLTAQAGVNSATLLAEANNPAYLQSQDQLSAAQTYYARQQAQFNSAHYISQSQLAADATQQWYESGGTIGAPDYSSIMRGEMTRASGGVYGGGVDPAAIWAHQLLDSSLTYQQAAAQGYDFSAPGCFPAGTRVLMANGSERSIETLQPGEQVLAHDGERQVPTVVFARIVPPPKQVYELVFDDGNRLTLTNAHPVASLQGWKSLSPAATKQENPELTVTRLQVGDLVHLSDETVCTLLQIEPHGVQQVYNITVGEPHTFYANGILVHNKVSMSNMGQQTSDQFAGIQLPHIDLSGIASSISGAVSGIQLPHIDLGNIGSSLSSAFSGIQLPHIDLGNIGSSLSGAFSGISLPHIDLGGITSSLSSVFSGISLPSIPDIGGQINGALSGMFSGISLPSIPDIGGQINGALSGMFGGFTLPSIPNIGAMLNASLSNMFGGFTLPSVPDVGAMISAATSTMFGGITLPSVPDVGAMLSAAMSSMFSGLQLPSIPNIGAAISSAMSGMFSGISLPSVPFFASGVENFAGGLAMVGEAGPELLQLPAGSSVYPMSSGGGVGASTLSPILGGAGSGGGGSVPQSLNLVVQLDSQSLIQAMGIPLASSIRVGMGLRSY